MKIEIQEITRILNEMTRLFPRPDGSQPLHWEELNEEQQKRACEAFKQVYETLQSYSYTQVSCQLPETLHDIWLQGAIADGWSYGKVYCPVEKKHPSMIPFNRLPETEKLKDQIWADVIRLYEPYI